MRAILTNVFDNPILTRELRRRMRGRALIFSIIGYIGLMTLATLMVLMTYSPSVFSTLNTKMLADLANTGSSLFRWITIIQSLLVLVIAPTITAGMTTGEKERKTFDFLRVTTITPWMYVTGCFLSTVFYVGLALICAFPLLSLTFVYGGVTPSSVFSTFGLLLGGSLILSSFGLYVSSIRERTRTAQGVIVFTIFAVLFGGVFLYNKAATVFGGGAGGLAGTISTLLTPGGIPAWLSAAFIIGFITWIFLLLATRKLFEPESTRAFSHWQFLAIAFVLIAPQLLAAHGAVLGEEIALVFYLTGQVLMLIAVLCFGVGRMEVGDEIWHLKRLVPVLRPFDQTVPFLVVLGALWWFSVTKFHNIAAGITSAPAGIMEIFLPISIASFAAMCALARLATSLTVGRSGAGAITASVMIVLWLIVPLIGSALYQLSPDMIGLAQYLIRLSPFILLFDSVGSPEGYAAFGDTMGVNAMVCYTYIALLVGLVVVGEYKRWKRWRGFDYHYDMPART